MRSILATAVMAGVLVAAVSLALAPSYASAQQGGTLELPPPPEDLPAALAVTVYFPAFAPVVTDHTCPDALAACVLGAGGGIGASLERRWSNGIAIGLGYEAWFMDSSGIYELGVMHELAGYLKKVFLRDNVVHPLIAAGIGGVLFGDTLRIATVGLAVDLVAGAEWELAHTVSVWAAFTGRLITLDGFEADGSRAQGFGVDVFLGGRLGFAIFASP